MLHHPDFSATRLNEYCSLFVLFISDKTFLKRFFRKPITITHCTITTNVVAHYFIIKLLRIIPIVTQLYSTVSSTDTFVRLTLFVLAET